MCPRYCIGLTPVVFVLAILGALFLINFAQTINIDSLIFAKGHSKDPRGHFVNLS